MTYALKLTSLLFVASLQAQQVDWVNNVKNKPVIDVRSAPYKAKCDGVSDDTGSIQTALTAAASVGGEVLIPSSSKGCAFTSTLTLSATATISGIGAGCLSWLTSGDTSCAQTGGSLLLCQTGASDCLAITGQHVTLHDFSIVGNNKTGGYAINMNGANYSILEHLYLRSTYGGVKLVNTVGVTLDKLKLYAMAMAGNAIMISGGNDQYLSHIMADWDGSVIANAAVQIISTGGAKILHSDFIHFAFGLLMNPGNGVAVTAIDDTANWYDTCGTGIYINPSAGGKVTIFRSIGSWTASSSGAGVYTGTTGTIDGLLFTQHVSINNTYQGFDFEGGTNISCTDCVGGGNGTGMANTYSGALIGAAVSHLTIRGGSFAPTFGQQNSQRYGIDMVAGASDYLTITGVNLAGNLTGALNYTSSGNHNSITSNNGYAWVVGVAGLPTCDSTHEGIFMAVSDSNTATWGVTAANGSNNHVSVYCDGTAWTVAAK